MSVQRTIDPDQIGFDPARLARIDEHFGRYVDDGRLAGWQIVVTRRRRGRALLDVRAARPGGGRPGRGGHAVADLLDDQAGHLGRGDDALGGGPVRADRRDQPLAARVRRRAGLRQGFGAQAVHGAGGRADPGLAPAHPHRRPDVRLHCRPRWSTASTGPPATTSAPPAGVGPGRAPARPAAELPLLFQPGTGLGLLASPPTCSAGWSRWSPGRAWTRSSPSGSSRPLGMTDTRWWVDERGRQAAGRAATRPHPAHRPGGPLRRARPRRRCAEPALLSGGGGLISTRRRLPPLHPVAAARRRAGRGTRCSGRARCAS